MRGTFAPILILLLLCCHLHVVAQNQTPFAQKYTPSITQGSVKKFIKDIEHRTKVNISYSDAYVDLKRQANLPAGETTVYDALLQILEGQKIQLRESGEKIFILSAEEKQAGATVATHGKIVISGYVKDKGSKEVLIGAIVYVPEMGIGTTTNSYGYYSMTLPAGEHNMLCSYVGYITDTFKLNNATGSRRDISMMSRSNLQEVNVVYEKETIAEHHHLGYNDIKSRPVILGENDVMRALQYLPGVQSGTEGTNTIMVRGGDPGQNLNLLDGVPLYYVDHFFGLTSIYNSEAIKSVDFHKGAFPSRYGGRLSSVIDVNTKDGDMEHWGGQFTMGLVKGSLNIEGPIVKDKASIMVSARRTWLDLLWRPMTKDLRLNFYDINGKANYILNKNNRIYFSLYNGRDKIGLGNTLSMGMGSTNARWGNTVASFKWTTIVNPKLFLNTTLTYSKFRFSIVDSQQIITYDQVENNGRYKGSSSVSDLAARMHANWYATAHQRIEFGANYSRARFIPTDVSSDGAVASPIVQQQADKFLSNEFTVYAEDEVKINDRWIIRPGLHFANWFSDRFNYSSLQPRFYTSYKLGQHHTIYASYAQMAQFLHLINNNTYGLPTDFWLPSSSRIEPEESALTTLGYSGKIGKAFSYNLEGYYKDISNIITYSMGKNLFDNSLNWDERIIQGKGWSYGAEAMAKLKLGKFDFSAAYTLSWTWRKFAQLNEGKAFPYRYDRRHNIRTALMYRPSARFEAIASWTYMSGEAITLPDQVYPDFDNNLGIQPNFSTWSANYTYNYVEWNNYRLPAIHRLDLGVNFIKKKGKRMERTWSLGVFNAYGRPNVMYVDLVNVSVDNGVANFKLQGLGLLRYIPYLSYNLRF